MSRHSLLSFSSVLYKTVSVALVASLAAVGVQAQASEWNAKEKSTLSSQQEAENALPPATAIGMRPQRPSAPIRQTREQLSITASSAAVDSTSSSITVEASPVHVLPNEQQESILDAPSVSSLNGLHAGLNGANALMGLGGLGRSSAPPDRASQAVEFSGTSTESVEFSSSEVRDMENAMGVASSEPKASLSPSPGSQSGHEATGKGRSATAGLATTIESQVSKAHLPQSFGFGWPIVLGKLVGSPGAQTTSLEVEQLVRSAPDSETSTRASKGTVIQVRVSPELRWTKGQEVFVLMEPPIAQIRASSSLVSQGDSVQGALVSVIEATPQNALAISRWALQGEAKKNAAQWLYAMTGLLSLFAVVCWGMRKEEQRRSAQQRQRLMRWGFQCALGCVWSDLAYWTVRDPAARSLVDLWLMFPALCVGAGLAFAFLRKIQQQLD